MCPNIAEDVQFVTTKDYFEVSFRQIDFTFTFYLEHRLVNYSPEWYLDDIDRGGEKQHLTSYFFSKYRETSARLLEVMKNAKLHYKKYVDEVKQLNNRYYGNK